MDANFNILDTVEICVTDQKQQKTYYRTKVQDIGTEGTFSTMIPSSDTGRPVIFFKDRKYELYSKGSTGIVLWTVHYLGMGKVDNLPACKFQVVSGPEITQRREFFRQPVSIDFQYYLMDNAENIDYQTVYKGRILDLSGGGCSFMCNESIMLRTQILSEFTFRHTPFTFQSEVLDRIDYTDTRADWDYKYRVRWTNANPKTIEALIQLVFAQQRELIVFNNSMG
ncbi:hypothetical protein Ami103574_03065 [Aminipila butyrica]|uniref:PilZ domain-containing protein n=1 Tax=Aminipila butyrica TaxID=433296 RepID=A0A858BW97_9FIRM|nr:PilZ domain-containing protein [Aminipila butyrica]QIB68356.1 hypothetical protein Ami103574_03065 [Aminipila butyrica]